MNVASPSPQPRLPFTQPEWRSAPVTVTPAMRAYHSPPFPFQQADLNCNIQDDAGAFYGVTSQYESSENMTVTCSTKVCSFGKQVVEKVEVSRPLDARSFIQGQMQGRPSNLYWDKEFYFFVCLFLVSPPFHPPFSHFFPLLLLKRQNDLKATERRQGGNPKPSPSVLPCLPTAAFSPTRGLLGEPWCRSCHPSNDAFPLTPRSRDTRRHCREQPGSRRV